MLATVPELFMKRQPLNKHFIENHALRLHKSSYRIFPDIEQGNIIPQDITKAAMQTPVEMKFERMFVAIDGIALFNGRSECGFNDFCVIESEYNIALR